MSRATVCCDISYGNIVHSGGAGFLIDWRHEQRNADTDDLVRYDRERTFTHGAKQGSFHCTVMILIALSIGRCVLAKKSHAQNPHRTRTEPTHRTKPASLLHIATHP